MGSRDGEGVNGSIVESPWRNLDLEPAVGFEPTTDGLQNRCSTTELNWLPLRDKDTKATDNFKR